jgi:hypothetical protein
MVFGTPTVAINGTQFKSSAQVTNAVLDGITGGETWLEVRVNETTGGTRTANITLEDHVGGSVATGRLFAVIVEREILYNAPNGETVHHNVFRKFLTNVNGEDIDMSSGMVTLSYDYTLDPSWQADEVYVVAWLTNPSTKEIYNSGTRFDESLVSTPEILVTYKNLHAYPNPARDQVSVSLPELFNESVNVTLLSAAGLELKRFNDQHVTASPITISLRDLATGLYYIVIEGKEGSYRARVVVE